MYTVHDLDLKVLSFLDRDARATVAEIAKDIGVSRQAVHNRIKTMESNGIILGHITILDSGMVGYHWYRALIRLLNITKQQKQTVITYLKDHPYVTWLGEVGGRWDIAVNFACRSPAAFNDISEELAVQFGSLVREMQILVYVNIYDYSRSYLAPMHPSRKQFFHKMSAGNPVTLDALDRKLIAHIAPSARMDHTQLGEVVGVSRNTVKNRLDRLMQQGLILGFRTFPNLQRIGRESHMLFLQINRLDRERETELYYYLQLLPQVTFVVKHIGQWKVGMEIETKTSREFQDVLIDIRSKFSDIINDYDTFPILQDHVVNYFPRGLLTEETQRAAGAQ